MIGPLAAHGIGGPTDLPIPMTYAVTGGAWALTATFAVVVLAWRTPRYATGTSEEPAPPPRRPWLAVLGLALTAWWLAALFAGPDDDNAGVGALYVLVWVGLVPLALVLGHVWRDLSPWRTVQAVVGRLTGRPDGLVAYPAWLGYWPAALGLLAFVQLELVWPGSGDAADVRVWVLGYVLLVLAGGVVFGPAWFDRADPFDVYSALVARLSPFVDEGRWRLHDPLRSLARTPVRPGLLAVLAVLLGSTAFDSFSATPGWQSASHPTTVSALTLTGFCVGAALLFAAAAVATGGVGGRTRRALPRLLAHSLVPIAVGYVVAHYLTYLVEKGQGVVLALLDPLGRGWQPLGDPGTAYLLSDRPGLLATLKVGAVVAGHVLAVLAAHDRAIALLPERHRLTGQLAMMLLMVVYTFTGLYLLLSV